MYMEEQKQLKSILRAKNKESQHAYEILKMFISLLYLRECGISARVNKQETDPDISVNFMYGILTVWGGKK